MDDVRTMLSENERVALAMSVQRGASLSVEQRDGLIQRLLHDALTHADVEALRLWGQHPGVPGCAYERHEYFKALVTLGALARMPANTAEFDRMIGERMKPAQLSARLRGLLSRRAA